MKSASHEISPKTLCWVGAAHVLLLLILALSGKLFQTEPKEDFIPLVGLPDQINPREGAPALEGSKQTAGPTNPVPSPHESIPAPEPIRQIQPAPMPTPPQPVVEQKQPEPLPPVKNDVPDLTPAPVKPPKTEKVKAPVKIDLDHVVTRKAENPNPSSNPTAAHTPKGGSSVSANQVENTLAQALGSTSGVHGGRGDTGTPGVPGGSVAGDEYRTLIKITLEKHWTSPSDDPALSTVVRIRILGDGSVLFLGIQTPSGSQAFDDSVVQAVNATKRMPYPPPTSLAHPDYTTTVRFRLND